MAPSPSAVSTQLVLVNNIFRRNIIIATTTSISTLSTKRNIHSQCHILSEQNQPLKEDHHTIILGAGIAGLTTAHYLSEKTMSRYSSSGGGNNETNKRKITIIDQYDGVARGTSRKNGALLCPSLSKSWTDVPLFFGDGAVFWRSRNGGGEKEEEVVVPVMTFDWRMIFDWSLWHFGRHWVLKRILSSSTNTNPIARLMNYSMKCMNEDFSDVNYSRVARGTKIATGELSLNDSSGDISQFCHSLATNMLRKYPDNITFELGQVVYGWERRKGKGDDDVITAVVVYDKTRNIKRVIKGESFVIALGTGAREVCSQLSIPCPIFPIKGHLATVVAPLSMIDYNQELSSRAFLSPLGRNTFRLSGFADICPPTNIAVDPDRIKALIDAAKPVLGEGMEVTDVDCGFRPMAPDDVPLLGRAGGFENVWLCVGHGSKGWTMGAGSGKLLADLMCGNDGEIKAGDYNPRRFEWFFYWKVIVEGLKRRWRA